MAASSSLKDYLKRYESKEEEEKKKKKKKKKTKPSSATGVLVVDEDPIWQKPEKIEEEEEDGDASADENRPQIDEDIEVKRMKRLEQLRLKRPYHAISEDGSGWVSISDASRQLNSSTQDSDLSPPRQQRARYDTPSPEVETKPLGAASDVPDLSPPRQKRRHYDTPSPEPETKPLDSISPDNDLSPPRHARPRMPSEHERKRTGRLDSPDLSPPRRVRHGSSDVNGSYVSSMADLSPPRRSKKDLERHELPDHSPLQRNNISIEANASRLSSVQDLSPPRKSRRGSPTVKERQGTGLVTRQEIKEENAKKKKEDFIRFKEMDPSISGRDAEPIYRDKIKGERISKEELLKSQKKDEKPKERKLEWGKGLAQKREAEARQNELELEKDKPFARTRDDPELDKMLKERLRWGDPMAHLVKRKHSGLVMENLGDDEKMKESGFVVPQDIPSHSWIKRGLDAPSNRYGIRPGRHWDGVDRSNGFEKECFKRMNEKRATETEAYLWSVSDM